VVERSRHFVEKVVAVRREGGSAALVSRASERIFAPLWIRIAARQLARRLREAGTLSAELDAVHAFEYRRFSLGPSQIASELLGFLETVREMRPRSIVEIGTGLGGTTVLLTRVAADDAIVVSVDLPLGYPRERLVAAAKRDSQRVHCLRDDSHAPETRDKVQALLGGRSIDVLFIDGDHSAEGVRADLALYAPLVRPGGWIGFHDIVPGPYEFVGGVPELWAELKETREAREFVDDWSQGGLGIGAFRNAER
jgi:predicted O-methyltransferase YrrM